MRIRNEQFERLNMYSQLCSQRLEQLFKNGIITEDQCSEEREKLNNRPSDIEECIKYLELILKNLNEIFQNSFHSENTGES